MREPAPATLPAERLFVPAFVLACLASLGAFASFYLLLATLPLYVAEIGGSESEVGLLIGIFSVTALVLRLFVGRAADRGGKKALMAAGAAVLVASSALYLSASTVPLLLAVRVLHGIGWALFGTAVNALVADVAPPTRRGEALGYFGMAGNLAMAIGPAIGVTLLRRTDFDVLFWTSVGIAAIALAATLAIRERRVTTPGSGHRGAMIERTALFPSSVLLLVSITYGAIVSFLPLYAASRGIGNPGLFFSAYAVTVLVGRTLGGKLADANGRAAAIVPGAVLTALALAVLAFAQALPGFLLAAVLYGSGFALLQPAVMALIVDRAPPARRGAAMGTFSTAIDLGIGGGSLVWGLVAQAAGYEAVYGAAAGVAVAALALFVAGSRRATR